MFSVEVGERSVGGAEGTTIGVDVLLVHGILVGNQMLEKVVNTKTSFREGVGGGDGLTFVVSVRNGVNAGRRGSFERNGFGRTVRKEFEGFVALGISIDEGILLSVVSSFESGKLLRFCELGSSAMIVTFDIGVRRCMLSRFRVRT